MSARVWTLGLGASVLLHGAGLAAIGLTTEPDPVPDQPVPKSQFTIEAAEVPRSRAEPEAAQGEAAAEAQAESTAAASGAVPQTRAEAAALPSDALASATLPAAALAASAAPATTLESSADSADRVSASAPPAATVTAATTAAPALAAVQATATAAVSVSPAGTSAPTLAAVSATPVTVSSAVAETTPVVAAAPTSAPLEATAATGPVQAPATPAAQTAPAAEPDAAPVSSAPLPATAGKATLAWAGEDDTPISSESLAAIAAFTQEGDLSAAASQVRDGIEGILAAVPCARLQTTFLPETGQLELRGHIPEDGLRGPVLAALREQVGDAIPLSDELLILPRPQCGALAGIADIGLPQSNEQLDNTSVIGADGFARNTTYREGERFYLEMTGADYDAYLYVDYFDKDGNVIHLQPNEFVPNELVPADAEVLVAKSDGDKPALELTIAPPFGQEIAAAFAASVPLYDGNRPLVEPAEPYLAFLKERVAATRAAHPDFKGEWVYFFITTQAR